MKHFHLGCTSGVITGIAGTGVIFAWRAAIHQYIERFSVSVFPVVLGTDPTGIGILVNQQPVMSSDYTGGTDVSDRTGAGSANYAIVPRIRDAQRVLLSSQAPISETGAGDIRVATTALLGGGGGGTPMNQPFITRGANWPEVATTSQAVPPLVLEWSNPSQGLEHEDPSQGCIWMPPDSGIVVQVSPLTALTGMTFVLAVEADFLE